MAGEEKALPVFFKVQGEKGPDCSVWRKGDIFHALFLHGSTPPLTREILCPTSPPPVEYHLLAPTEDFGAFPSGSHTSPPFLGRSEFQSTFTTTPRGF